MKKTVNTGVVLCVCILPFLLLAGILYYLYLSTQPPRYTPKIYTFTSDAHSKSYTSTNPVTSMPTPVRQSSQEYLSRIPPQLWLALSQQPTYQTPTRNSGYPRLMTCPLCDGKGYYLQEVYHHHPLSFELTHISFKRVPCENCNRLGVIYSFVPPPTVIIKPAELKFR